MSDENMDLSQEEDAPFEQPVVRTRRGRPATREARRSPIDTRHASRQRVERPDRDIEKNVREKRGDFSKPRPWNRRVFSIPTVVEERFKHAGYKLKFVLLDDSEIKMHEIECWRPVLLSEVPEFGASTLPSGSSYYAAYQEYCVSADQVLMKIKFEDFAPYQAYFDQERERDNMAIRQALDNSDNYLSPFASMKNVRPISIKGPSNAG